MRRQIFRFAIGIAISIFFVSLLQAQISFEDLQKLKPQATQLMLPLPTGKVLRGEGLDDWLGGFGAGGQSGAVRGFGSSAKSNDQKFFTLGEFYTLLIVQAHSASTLDAAAAVNSFREVLILLRAPDGFFSYLNEFELLIKSQAGGTDTAGRFAAAMQGFLSDFVRSKGEAAYLRFLAGRWVTTMALAAHSHDATGMQLSAASFFRPRLAEQKARPGVDDILRELEKLAESKTLANEDFSKIETLAQQLRSQLG